jgi:hypothetical protein
MGQLLSRNRTVQEGSFSGLQGSEDEFDVQRRSEMATDLDKSQACPPNRPLSGKQESFGIHCVKSAT